MIKYLFFLIILILFSCCKNEMPREVEISLDLAGENKKELIDVIEHYSLKKSDSLKLKAAYYLISNMKHHKYISLGDIYERAFLNAENGRKLFIKKRKYYNVHDLKNYTNKIFKNSLDSINSNSNNSGIPKHQYDIESITSNFLVENIDLAFEVYKNNPLKLCNKFSNFLSYILPYRVGDEPLEVGKRKELYNEYKWVIDSLKVKPLDSIVKSIYNDLSIQGVWGNTNHYPYTQSLSQIEQTRFGTCTEAGIYFVNLFRAIGIPSGIDYTPRWGNWHKSEGHSWLFYLTEDGFESINVALDRFEKVKDLYEICDIPKIYRQSYKNITLENGDVTQFYRKTYDVRIELPSNDDKTILRNDNFFLAVFDYDKGWDIAVNATSFTEKEVIFKNVGNNIIYMPLLRSETQLLPFSQPFRLERAGEIYLLKNDNQILDEAVITRKFMPFLTRDRKEKMRWIKTLNGTILQGSNSNIEDEYVDIHKIVNYNSSNNVTISLEKEMCFRFFRLKGPKEKSINLANFKLTQNEIINWDSAVLNNDEQDEVDNVIDNDPLTYIDKKNMVFTYDLGKLKCITGFQIQARNDDNNIKIGDLYELYYWDDKWNSLGKKIAKDTLLLYNNIPRNYLYLLKNHTRGKEESVFTFDEDGKQFWTGVSEYKNLDSIMLDYKKDYN